MHNWLFLFLTSSFFVEDIFNLWWEFCFLSETPELVKAVSVKKYLAQFISFRIFISWEILFSCIEIFFANISFRRFRYVV